MTFFETTTFCSFPSHSLYDYWREASPIKLGFFSLSPKFWAMFFQIWYQQRDRNTHISTTSSFLPVHLSNEVLFLGIPTRVTLLRMYAAVTTASSQNFLGSILLYQHSSCHLKKHLIYTLSKTILLWCVSAPHSVTNSSLIEICSKITTIVFSLFVRM